MNKKMREILAKIDAKQKLAKGYTEGENKDYKKAQEILDEIKTLKEEYQIEKRLFEEEKELNKLSEEEAKEVAEEIEWWIYSPRRYRNKGSKIKRNKRVFKKFDNNKTS